MTESTTESVTPDASQAAAPSRSRRLFRWLLVMLAVVAIVPLVFVGYCWRQQMAFIERHENAETGLIFTSRVTTAPVGPDWLRNYIGEQRMRGFDKIVAVQELVQASAEDLRFLSRRPVRELHLFDTQLTASGIEALGEMQELRTLELGAKTTVSEPLLKALSGLTKLETLRFTDAEQFSSRNIIVSTGGIEIAVMDQLAISDRGPLIDASLSPRSLRLLQRLPKLKFLSFRKMEITDAYLEQIAQLQQLEFLDLCGTHITNDGMASLAQLPSLKYLNLSYTVVGDQGLADFHGHPSIQTVDLVDTKLTFGGLQSLKASLPGCNVNLTFETKPAE